MLATITITTTKLANLSALLPIQTSSFALGRQINRPQLNDGGDNRLIENFIPVKEQTEREIDTE